MGGILVLAAFTSGALAFWVKPVLVTLAAVTCMLAMRHCHANKTPNPLDYAVIALSLYMGVSVLWSVEPFYAATASIVMALLPCCYAVGRWHRLSPLVITVCAACLACFAFCLAVSPFDYAFFPWLNVNQFGLFMAVGFSVCAVYLIAGQTRGAKAFYLWLAALAMQAVIILTLSRSVGVVCLMSIVTACAVLRWAGHTCHWRHALGLFLSLVGLWVGIQLVLLGTPMHMSGGAMRLIIWETAWEAYRQAPLLGAGLGNFVAVYTPLQHGDDLTAGMSAHNDILHMMVELGALGVVIALSVAVSAIYAFARGDKDVPSVAAFVGLCVFAAQGLVTSLWPHPALLISVALLVACLANGATAVAQSDCHVSPRWRIILPTLLLIWLGYTACVTMGGVAVRMSLSAMHAGDLAGFVAHLNTANAFYMPDDPRVTEQLHHVKKTLESLH